MDLCENVMALYYRSGVEYLLPTVSFQKTAVLSAASQLLTVRITVAPSGQFSGITAVYQANENEPNDS